MHLKHRIKFTWPFSSFCFQARLSARLLIWKRFFILMQLKLIFTIERFWKLWVFGTRKWPNHRRSRFVLIWRYMRYYLLNFWKPQKHWTPTYSAQQFMLDNIDTTRRFIDQLITISYHTCRVYFCTSLIFYSHIFGTWRYDWEAIVTELLLISQIKCNYKVNSVLAQSRVVLLAIVKSDTKVKVPK